MDRNIHEDQIFIEALLLNDKEIIGEIYRLFSNKVKKYILANSGSAEDAADIFQESLVDLYQQAKYKNLQLTSPFESFLLLICKRKWLNHLKKKSIQIVADHKESASSNVGEDTLEAVEEVLRNKEEMDIYLAALEEMDEKCKKLIKETMKGEPQEKVAERLNISYTFLRKKKSKCVASLIRLVREKYHPGEVHN